MQRAQIYAVACLALAAIALIATRAVGASFPKTIGDWRCVQEIEQDPEVMKYLPSAVIADRIYRDSQGRTMNLTLLTAQDYVDYHDPWFCFRGQGFQMSDKENLVLDGQECAQITASRDNIRMRAVYWWWGRANERPKYAPEQWNRVLALRAKLMGKQEKSLQVRIVTEDSPDAVGQMEEFVRDIHPALEKLYGGK